MTSPQQPPHQFLTPGSDSPLSFAVDRRDGAVMDMVRDAVRHNRAVLAFQPVVSSADFSSPAFHEGLIRIMDDTGRIIPAGSFMGAVENSELGREIDVLALEAGCYALSITPALRLSINMSARSIGYTPWMQTLERWLDRDKSIGPRLILEITESSVITVPELVIDFMDRLQMRGICFALDDFGAGYTAIRYFKHFFFDILKIDGQFVRGIAKDEDNRTLTEAIRMMAKQFDMLCVAEMVENQADARVLRDIGVECQQGYFFGAPTVKPDWLPGGTRQIA